VLTEGGLPAAARAQPAARSPPPPPPPAPAPEAGCTRPEGRAPLRRWGGGSGPSARAAADRRRGVRLASWQPARTGSGNTGARPRQAGRRQAPSAAAARRGAQPTDARLQLLSQGAALLRRLERGGKQPLWPVGAVSGQPACLGGEMQRQHTRGRCLRPTVGATGAACGCETRRSCTRPRP
jgi:pyruvate/2-oxoglutarate dehydrogenase complex dihydrolipoamide acyltransferase (E2) component